MSASVVCRVSDSSVSSSAALKLRIGCRVVSAMCVGRERGFPVPGLGLLPVTCRLSGLESIVHRIDSRV